MSEKEFLEGVKENAKKFFKFKVDKPKSLEPHRLKARVVKFLLAYDYWPDGKGHKNISEICNVDRLADELCEIEPKPILATHKDMEAAFGMQKAELQAKLATQDIKRGRGRPRKIEEPSGGESVKVDDSQAVAGSDSVLSS